MNVVGVFVRAQWTVASAVTSRTLFVCELKAQWNFSLAGLLDKLRDPGQRPNYDWIRQRISRTWPMWLHSAMNLASTTNPLSSALSTRHRKRVCCYFIE